MTCSKLKLTPSLKTNNSLTKILIFNDFDTLTKVKSSLRVFIDRGDRPKIPVTFLFITKYNVV